MDGPLSPYQQTTLMLFGGVLAVLVGASAVGALLAHRVARGAPHAVIDNLNARVNAWWVMVLVIGLAFVFGHAGVMVLFLFISFYALREFTTLVYTRRGDHGTIAAAFFVGVNVVKQRLRLATVSERRSGSRGTSTGASTRSGFARNA